MFQASKITIEHFRHSQELHSAANAYMLVKLIHVAESPTCAQCTEPMMRTARAEDDTKRLNNMVHDLDIIINSDTVLSKTG